MLGKFFRLFNKQEAEEVTSQGREVIKKVTEDLEKFNRKALPAPVKATIKKKPTTSKPKCVTAHLMNAAGLTDEYTGIILKTETCTKWKNTPTINYVLVVRLNGIKVKKPYVKMINNIYCSPAKAFPISGYETKFNKEQWLKESKPSKIGDCK